MPEHKFRALRYLAIDEIESAVQIVAMANDSHGMSGILRRAAAAHVVADLGLSLIHIYGEYRPKNERRTQKCYNHARTTTPQPLLPTMGCAGTMRRNRWKADGTDAGSMLSLIHI